MHLIIVAGEYEAVIATFANAKAAQGFSVNTWVPSSSSATVIKDYIEGLWGGPDSPDYILLVGDTNTIPHWTGGGAGSPATDLPYACMDGVGDWYPDIAIGWSTHESPEDTVPVGVALALGATMFERHVGVATDEIQLNAYSSTPEQLSAWLAAHARAKVLLGPVERPPVSAAEQDAIDSLRRGVYARRPLRKGTAIGRDQVFFAMPYTEGQLESGGWKEGVVTNEDIPANGALPLDGISIPEDEDVQIIKSPVCAAINACEEVRDSGCRRGVHAAAHQATPRDQPVHVETLPDPHAAPRPSAARHSEA